MLMRKCASCLAERGDVLCDDPQAWLVQTHGLEHSQVAASIDATNRAHSIQTLKSRRLSRRSKHSDMNATKSFESSQTFTAATVWAQRIRLHSLMLSPSND